MTEEIPLLQNKPIFVPQINATIILLSARRVIQKSERGRQTIHKGQIRITQEDISEVVHFIVNQSFTYNGFRLQVEGLIGSLVLTISKPQILQRINSNIQGLAHVHRIREKLGSNIERWIIPSIGSLTSKQA